MANNYHPKPADEQSTDENGSEQKQGNLFWVLLVGFVSTAIAAAAIIAVVWVSRHLEPTKDTEVGILAVVATVTLLAILGQIVVTALQWQAMRDSLRRTDTLVKQNEDIAVAAQRQATATENALQHAKDSLNATLRAYLSVDSVEVIDGPIPQKRPIEFTFNIINGGQTAAFEVIASTRAFSLDVMRRAEAKTAAQQHPLTSFIKTGPSVGGGKTKRFTPSRGLVKSDVSEGTIAGVNAGSQIYLFITITFRDFQRKEWLEVLSYRYERHTQVFVPYEDPADK